MTKKLFLFFLLYSSLLQADVYLEQLRKAIDVKDITTLEVLSSEFNNSPLAIYPHYYRLKLTLDSASDAEVAMFLARYKDTLLAEKLRIKWLKELAQREQWAKLIESYQQINKPTLELTCHYLNANAKLKHVQLLAKYKTLWFSASSLPTTCQPAIDLMFEQGILKEEDIWQRIRLSLANNNTQLAMYLANQVSTLDRLSILQIIQTPDKQLPMLNLKTRLGQELAIFALNRIARTHPTQAVVLLETYQVYLPETIAKTAWGQIGFIAAKQLLPEALQWYRRADVEKLSAEERSWMMRIAIRYSDWPTVRFVYEKMPAAEQLLPSWQYWYARALKEIGKHQLATSLFNALASAGIDYYNVLAKEELNNITNLIPDDFTPSLADVETFKKRPEIKRILSLYNNPKWRSEAAEEWNWAMQGLTDKSLLAASFLAYQIGWYDRAIFAAERTKQVHNYTLRFPLPEPYDAYIRQYALKHGLDMAWIYGLIRQESRFAPNIKSTAGAIGLMQIMPATAKWIARKLAIKQLDLTHVYQPDLNIKFGLYYLDYIFNLMEKNSVLATASYNAGPGWPKKWLINKSFEAAKWIESIPFKETREYVKKVMTNAIYYGQRIDKRSNLLKLHLGVVPAQAKSPVLPMYESAKSTEQ